MKSKIALVTALLSVSGCMDLSPNSLQGKYEGTWIKKGTPDAIPVHVTLIADPENSDAAIATITDPKGETFKAQFEKTGKTRANLTMSGKTSAEMELSWSASKSSKNRPCLSSSQGELCFSDDELVFSFTDAQNTFNTVSLTKVPENLISKNAQTSAAPQVYTLSELLDLADHYDFGTRIEYQRYLESRYNAKATALSLLPHVNIGTVGNLIGGLNPGSLLNVIGDLVPFLLPTRWLQKKESKLASKAERLSVAIIRLNAVLYTESLAYTYFRDKKAIATLEDQRASISKIYRELQTRERFGQLPHGTSQDIAAILNSVDQALLLLRKTVTDELESVSLSVGFTNPKAVLAIAEEGKRDIHHPVQMPESQLIQQSVILAPELAQADFLIDIARTKKVETYFTWLDPSGATPQLSLGAALFPATKNAQAQIKEFETIKEQTRAQLANKVAGLFANSLYSVENEKLAIEANQIQAARVKRILNQLSFGTNFILADLVNALQDQVQSKVSEIGNAALYQVSEAQIDRVLLRGVYQKYHLEDESASTVAPRE